MMLAPRIGLKWCARGQHWRILQAFAPNRSTADRLATRCRDCTHGPVLSRQAALVAEARRREHPGPVRHPAADDCLHCQRIARETTAPRDAEEEAP